MDSISVIKALSDLSRLRVMWLLSDKEELCVCQITEILGLAMPTVSRHMAILNNAGLVSSRKESRWVYYHKGDTYIKNNEIQNFVFWSQKDYEEQIVADKKCLIECKS